MSKSWEDDIPALRLLWAGGASISECGRALHRTRAAVRSKMIRLGWLDDRACCDIAPDEGEPSPAAIRLARFDPVLRRALEQRARETA